MRRVCVVIMWSLQTRIEKSFSYSISYSYSNLKSPNISIKTKTKEKREKKNRKKSMLIKIRLPSLCEFLTSLKRSGKNLGSLILCKGNIEIVYHG